MSAERTTGPAIVECGWAGRALDGVSGDRHVIVPFAPGTLVGLIDGLGHGPEAAEAATTAANVLQAHAGKPLPSLIEQCHQGLRRTRGVVMSLAWFDGAGAMSGIGIGNVDAILIRGVRDTKASAAAISLRAGVVGFQMPPLYTSTFAVARGDTLVMATDGIRSLFASDIPITLEPQEIAESILARFARGNDDAHVLVARYLGPPT